MARVPHPSKSMSRVSNGDGAATPMYHTGHGAPAYLAQNVRNANFDAAIDARNAAMGGMPDNDGDVDDRMLADNWGAKTMKKLRASSDVLRGNVEAAKNRFVQPNLSQTAVIPPPGLGNPRGVVGY